MKTSTVYRTKAEKYARYRWDYAPQALATIIEQTQLPRSAIVADIGAGTGIFTKQLVARFNHVVAIEPNAEMRHFAEHDLDCRVLAGSGEATGLPDASADLITIAQALHWIDPAPARQELHRILKPNGWLAVLHNHGVPNTIGREIGKLYSAEYGFDPTYNALRPPQKPLPYYFGHTNFNEYSFQFERQETLESFIGALGSAANSPDETDPLYSKLLKAVDAIFEQFSIDGLLPVTGVTKLSIGQLTK